MSFPGNPFILSSDQEVDLTVVFKDRAGNIAPTDGPPVWASSDPAIVALTLLPDGVSVTATAVGPVGTAQVSVTGDARLGADQVLLVGVQMFEVVAGEAFSANVTPGAPRLKPTP